MKCLLIPVILTTVLVVVGCGRSNEATTIIQSDADKAAYEQLMAEEDAKLAAMTPEERGE